MIFVLEVPDRIHRIKNFAPGLAGAGFCERGNKSGMIRAGNGRHRVTVRVGGDSRALFVRRASSGYEMNFIQMKAPFRCPRNREVPYVNRVKRAAEKRNALLAILLP